MKTNSTRWQASLTIIVVIVFSMILKTSLSGEDYQAEVSRIFKKSCSVTGCHSGKFPPMELNLEQDKFLRALVNIPSKEFSDQVLVDTENPERSYLFKKILGNEGIKGKRMPLGRDALTFNELKTIEAWILTLKGSALRQVVKDESISRAEKKSFSKPAFWGAQLVNLPTDRSIGKKSVLFRISHRYFQPVNEGYSAFYGLDGPAVMMFSLGYGIADNLGLTLGYSNRFKEIDLSFKWVFLEQSQTPFMPISVFVNAGGGWVTQKEPGRDTFSLDNMRFFVQMGLSHQISDAFSLLLVPSYTSNVVHYQDSKEGTFALGFGGRIMFLDDLSFIVEWSPIVSGIKLDESGWGLGIEWKVGGHVFQIVATNTFGLASAQYLPGGDLRLSSGDFRLGFNILRWF